MQIIIIKILIIFQIIIQIFKFQNQAEIGTNIGGLFVLEPWITPSLFYRFLGKKQNDGVAMDTYTFCKYLGPVEGNKIMKAHWNSFYREEDIKELAQKEVKMVRLPIGDWSINQYGPYIGCMDGVQEQIDWFMNMCHKYNIDVWLDVHAVIGSQNGKDHSGYSQEIIWKNEINFSHYPNMAANWMGDWDFNTQQYQSINQENLNFSIKNTKDILIQWGKHPAFKAFEPVNEPWENSNIEILHDFYRQTRKLTQQYAPQAYFLIYYSLKQDPSLYNNIFDNNDKVVIDMHIYQFREQDAYQVSDFCALYQQKASVAQQLDYEVWVGEWSLGTDNCPMWLLGLNDSNADPQFKCTWIDCPQSYLPTPYNYPLDRDAEILGPFGTANDPQDVCIQKGKCPIDSSHFNSKQIKQISQCAIQQFNKYMTKQFFWCGKNEMEPRWSYIESYNKGWLSNHNNNQNNLYINN